MQAAVFDYWARGDDLRAIEKLQKDLLESIQGNTDRYFDELQVAEAMEEIEKSFDQTRVEARAATTSNVWTLSLTERQALLKQWYELIDTPATIRELERLQLEHRSLRQDLEDIRMQKEVRVMQQHNIVGMTTTTCAKKRKWLEKVGFEIMICEEAAEVLEAHALCTLLPSLKHAIHIGDPLQLRPEVEEHAVALENPAGRPYRLNESLFERVMKPIDHAAKTVPTTQLNVQRRMHPAIADITRLTYPSLQDHPGTYNHPIPKGLQSRISWLDHEAPEDIHTGVSKSATNFYEVGIVHGLVTYLLRGSAYGPGDIAVLTPYSGQLQALRNVLSQICQVWLSDTDQDVLVDAGALDAEKVEFETAGPTRIPMKDMLRLATIDNFQGEEAKIIILSTVRSGHKLGFVRNPNRINVMMSRAQDGLYIIGNATTLEADYLWGKIVDTFVEKEAISNSIRLQCDRHPSHFVDASTADDFLSFPTCQAVCDSLLECGHKCPESCHEPALHSIIPCRQTCGKTLSCGHACQSSCTEECPPCTEKVRNSPRACGHKSYSICGGEVLPCQHFEGYIDLPCGRHSAGRTCGQSVENLVCKEICGEPLGCGHNCENTCGSCYPGAEHGPCLSTCGKSMQCGHDCDKACHGQTECPACNQLRKTKCQHETVTNCNEPLLPCTEVVVVQGDQAQYDTLCCLVATIESQPIDIPTNIQKMVHDIIKATLNMAEELNQRLDEAKITLDQTRDVFLEHSLSSKVLTANNDFQQLVRRTDDLIQLQHQASGLDRKLKLLSTGLKRLGQADTGSLQAQDEVSTVELRALAIRAEDRLETARYLLKAEDLSYQMSRAAEEILRALRRELWTTEERFGRTDGPGLNTEAKRCAHLNDCIQKLLESLRRTRET